MSTRVTRRRFAQGLGATILAFTLRPNPALAQVAAKPLPGSLGANRMLDGWIRIDPHDTVTIFTGKVELGQGILTALRQIAAEELDLDPDRLVVISGDTAQTPDEGVTSGSQSIEVGGTALRLAAAEARSILLDLAAAKLGVAAETLGVEDGTIAVRDGTARTTYWEVASPGLLRREATGTVPPKSAAEHRIVGRSLPRIDIPAKVTGGAVYVQDLRLPGMLFGRIVRPPSYGARLLGLDELRFRQMPGVVTLVHDGSLLGVIALREEQAIAARAAMRDSAHWREGPGLPDPQNLHEHLRELPSREEVISEKSGSGGEVAQRLTATYTRPYLAHASIGPSCAAARFERERLDVWSHTQGVFPLRRDLAKVLDMPEDRITVHHAQGSGCYGQNGADDVALDAALLARAVPGRPVKVQWMRDDEFAWEPFGPAMAMSAGAGLAKDGTIVDWSYEVWSNTHGTRPGAAGGAGLLAGWYIDKPVLPPAPADAPQPAGGGDRNAVPLYEVPRQRVTRHFIPDMPLRVSALRSLGAHANIFAIESFMDELAAAAGADPVAFRLGHLRDDRARAVITAAAAKAQWQADQKGDGLHGRGIGFAKYKNLASYLAVIADIAIDRSSGVIRVVKAVAAVDAGQIVNPDGISNQIEGGIIQATSWTLKEEVAFDRKRIVSRDWDGYPILRFPEVPAIDIVLLDRPDEPSLGAGEAAAGPMAAAIANAFAHATGRRLRDLPLNPDRVKAALG
ncbi:MAG: xanthine dehydrogenase family protein molybdopterin-binding subunit [Alphaproteobacteria bacterium]|nr:xanthine dehydrogenase family protein molybdopterin-binding subunit [Alphaproteobacteria bacterium]